MKLDNTFKLDNNICELPSYYNNQPAKFHLYKNCIISDCIRRGYRWEEHQHEIAIEHIKSNSIVMEVGAHIGTLTIVLSKLAKKVYTFEPLPNSFDLLVKNLQLNNCTNVIASNQGISDKIGETTIEWIGDNNSGATVLKGGSVKTNDFPKLDNKIDLITIDSLCLDKLDYLKIDVEGFEENVLRGGLETIKKCQPIIIMECMEDYYKGTIIKNETLESRFKQLLDMGYAYKNLAAINKNNNVWDVLFLPKTKNI
tara:strand:- start:527 stop:1291 length:765 start_codon:yes stop_codon:yes gene_type:complete